MNRQQRRNGPYQNLDQRVTRLESKVDALGERFEVGFSSLEQHITQLSHNFDRQVDRQRITPTGIFAGISLFLAMLATGYTVHTQSLTPLEIATETNQETFHHHINQPGHLEALLQAARQGKSIEQNTKEFDKLSDIVLDLYGDSKATQERLKHLEKQDGRLQ